MRLAILPLLATSALALAACGSDDDAASTTPSGAATTATTASSSEATAAAKEAGETKEAIEAALATYKSGDRAKAQDQVAEAYVSHFEHVEHELEEHDAELKESLEERISGELRQAMKAGDDAKVDQLGEGIEEDLEKAEQLLGGAGEGAAAAGTPLEEARATKEAVEEAVETYEGGDAAAAEEQVAEAYVSHFEHVEHELEEKDAELMESLEERIAVELRQAIKAKDDKKVTSLEKSIVADLEKAEALLR